MSPRAWSLVALTLLLPLLGCDSASDDPAPSGARMSARIDGVAWAATTNVVAVRTGEFVGVSGVGPGSATVALGMRAEVGTHRIEPIAPANAAYSLPLQNAIWLANAGSGSGTITVTSVDAEHITGTFSFIAEAASGATGTRVVTNGQFDAPF